MILQYKNVYLIVLFCFCTLLLKAQSNPQISQYILNPYIINPAFAGIENYYDVKVSYRKQWVGLEGAPETVYGTIHAPISKKDKKNSATTLYGNYQSEKKNKQYWNDYKASKAHSGVGAKVQNDAIGPFNNLSVMGTYAYHMGISSKVNLAFGLSAGVKVTSLNINKLFFGTNATQDPAIFYTNEIDKYNMDADVGLLLYSAKYYFGISALSIIPQNLAFSDNFVASTNSNLLPNYFVSGGLRFPINEDFTLLPSFRARYLNPQPMQLDLNAKLHYRDLVWGGIGYRTNYGLIGLIGMNVLSTFTISYSYDFTTTQINSVSNGSHEIVLGFSFNDGRKTKECRSAAW